MRKPIVITCILIAVCFLVGFAKSHKAPAIPDAPPALAKYVQAHLDTRQQMSISGDEIFAWYADPDEGYCKELSKSYTLINEGSDIVNGKKCLSVRLKPDNKLRPWIQFWIEPATKQVLCAREWSAENSAKRVGINTNGMMSELKKQNPPNGLPAALPENFTYMRHTSLSSGIDHYLYSDGLQLISVFIGSKGSIADDLPETVMESGITRVQLHHTKDHTILVTADLPADVLNKWTNQLLRQLLL